MTESKEAIKEFFEEYPCFEKDEKARAAVHDLMSEEFHTDISPRQRLMICQGIMDWLVPYAIKKAYDEHLSIFSHPQTKERPND